MPRRNNWIDLPLEVVTPILSGRGGLAADSLRVLTLRGVLASWFRMLVGVSYLDDIPGLLALEQRFFGRAADAAAADPQSNIMLRPVDLPKTVAGSDLEGLGFPTIARAQRRPSNNEQRLAYLAGQGLYAARGDSAGFTREVVPPGAQAKLQVAYSDPDAGAVLAASMAALTRLGGLGARSRRAFGGLTVDPAVLTQLDPDLPSCAPGGSDPRDHMLAIGAYLRGRLHCPPVHDVAPGALTPLAVIAPEAWCSRVVGTAGSLEVALPWLGKSLRDARAPIPRPAGFPPKHYAPTVTNDYVATVMPALQGGTVTSHQVSSPSLGLPMGYRSGRFDGWISSSSYGRRASPLWLRVLRSPTDPGSFDLVAHAFFANFLNGAGPWPLEVVPRHGYAVGVTLTANDFHAEVARVLAAL